METIKTLKLSLAAMAAVFGTADIAAQDTTFVAQGNPLVRYKYTADPGALVDKDGTMYIYAGHDVCPAPHNYYKIDEWLVFSSKDMKTWREHPVPLKAADFEWGPDTMILVF